MRVQTKAIREGRTLYLLEEVNVPEGQQVFVTIETSQVDDDGDKSGPSQETLADVLGSENEERSLAESKRQREALLEMAQSSTASSGLTDVSERHDYYIYVEPYERRLKGEND
jgi:hypothetical protein